MYSDFSDQTAAVVVCLKYLLPITFLHINSIFIFHVSFRKTY